MHVSSLLRSWQVGTSRMRQLGVFFWVRRLRFKARRNFRRLLCLCFSELFRSISTEDKMIDISLVLVLFFRNYCSSPKNALDDGWLAKLSDIWNRCWERSIFTRSLTLNLILAAFQSFHGSFWISSEQFLDTCLSRTTVSSVCLNSPQPHYGICNKVISVPSQPIFQAILRRLFI